MFEGLPKELRDFSETRLPHERVRGRVKSVRIEEVIVVDCVEGTGDDADPLNGITTYWTKAGKKIGEYDPVKEQRSKSE